MDLRIDGKPQLTLQSQPGTIGAVLLEVNAYLQGNGRALQRVTIDGRLMAPEDLTPELGARPVDSVSTVEVESARVGDLVLESLDEVASVLPELPIACQTLSAVLASDTPEEGFEGYGQLMAVWAALRERRQQVIGALGISAGSLELAGRTLQAREEALAAALARAGELREAQEHSTLADLLAYDLSELAEEEAAVIALLRSCCADAA